jgi:hypothetical protein
VNVAGNSSVTIPGIPAGTSFVVGDQVQYVSANTIYTKLAGAGITQAQGDLRYFQLAAANAPTALTTYGLTNISITGGTANQALTTNGSGALSWASYATAASLSNYLPLTGGTLSGGFVVNGPCNLAVNQLLKISSNNFYFNPAAQSALLSIDVDDATHGYLGGIEGQVNGTRRWRLLVIDGSNETGSNTGSNFSILPCSDGGVVQPAALSITRATGVMTLGQMPSIPGGSANQVLTTNGAGVLSWTAPTVTGYLPLTGGTLTGDLGLTYASPTITMNRAAATNFNIIKGQLNGGDRWQVWLGDGTTEAGNNVGSNFIINAYSNSNILLATPAIQIQRTVPNAPTNPPANVTAASMVQIKTLVGQTLLAGGSGNTAILYIGNPGANSSIIYLDRYSSGNGTGIWGRTSGVNRWYMNFPTGSESGTGNNGGDWALGRYTDAGVLIDNPISIVRATGVVTFSQAIVNPSALALKENISPIDDALAIVKRLTGVRFNRKGQNRREVGVIAEDTREVLPEVVIPTTNGTPGVAYAQIVAVLIEAIKELEKRIG